MSLIIYSLACSCYPIPPGTAALVPYVFTSGGLGKISWQMVGLLFWCSGWHFALVSGSPARTRVPCVCEVGHKSSHPTYLPGWWYRAIAGLSVRTCPRSFFCYNHAGTYFCPIRGAVSSIDHALCQTYTNARTHCQHNETFVSALKLCTKCHPFRSGLLCLRSLRKSLSQNSPTILSPTGTCKNLTWHFWFILLYLCFSIFCDSLSLPDSLLFSLFLSLFKLQQTVSIFPFLHAVLLLYDMVSWLHAILWRWN